MAPQEAPVISGLFALVGGVSLLAVGDFFPPLRPTAWQALPLVALPILMSVIAWVVIRGVLRDGTTEARARRFTRFIWVTFAVLEAALLVGAAVLLRGWGARAAVVLGASFLLHLSVVGVVDVANDFWHHRDEG